jgi:ornithine carbamoyltransferase
MFLHCKPKERGFYTVNLRRDVFTLYTSGERFLHCKPKERGLYTVNIRREVFTL